MMEVVECHARGVSVVGAGESYLNDVKSADFAGRAVALHLQEGEFASNLARVINCQGGLLPLHVSAGRF